MAVKLPIANPIRFYDTVDVVNNSTKWPNAYNQRPRVDYQKGIYSNKQYYKEWVINKDLKNQILVSSLADENLTVYKYNTTTYAYDVYGTLAPSDISPTGWTGLTVNLYTFTPSAIGTYYIEQNEGGYISDKFVVVSESFSLRNMIEIIYVNSENDIDLIFFDLETSVYTGLAYFTGIFEPGTVNDKSVTSFDRGTEFVNRATPVGTATVTITDIHNSYLETIQAIFSCNTLTVNGYGYSSAESVQSEKIPGTDLLNITVLLRETKNNYYVK